MEKKTTIQVDRETKAMLGKVSGDEESYDRTIRELVYHYLDFLVELDERANAVLNGEVETRPLDEFLRDMDERVRATEER